jgi:hypothetical protein
MTSFITTMFVLHYFFSSSTASSSTTTPAASATMPLYPSPARPSKATPTKGEQIIRDFARSTASQPNLLQSDPESLPRAMDPAQLQLYNEKPLPPTPKTESPLKRALKSAWMTTSIFGSNVLSPFTSPSSSVARDAQAKGKGTPAKKPQFVVHGSASHSATVEADPAEVWNPRIFVQDDDPYTDSTTVDSNARSRAPFKPNKSGRGTTSWQLKQFAEATLGSGSLKKAVLLPEGEDLDEWLAVNGEWDLAHFLL